MLLSVEALHGILGEGTLAVKNHSMDEASNGLNR
jgi:hypothetical protein